MKKIVSIMIILFGVLLIFITGCVVDRGTRVSAFSYVEGNLRTTYYGSMPDTWEAARNALDQFEMTSDLAEHDGFAGTLEGTMVDGREYTISLSRVDEEKTEVTVLIGLGDRNVAEAILNKLAENLKRKPPQAEGEKNE